MLRARDLAIGYAPSTSKAGPERGRPSASSGEILLGEHLDLELAPGRLVALLGPNGAGKSTLLRTLAGLLPPRAGALELDGRPLGTWPAAERARRLAVVLTRRPQAGEMRVAELVALGRFPHTDFFGRLTDRDRAEVARALDLVDAGALAERRLAELSDGEYQRVALARALAQEAEILLLDEITAFLDLPRRVEILQLLRCLAHGGRAILVTTHDLELALRAADTLWLLGRGGRFRAGAPEELAMGGELAATFASERPESGVFFDADLGTFVFAGARRGTARLDGEGRAALWTARALERLGYRVTAEGEVAVAVEAGEKGLLWRLERAGELRRFETLGALLDALGDA